MTKPKTDEPKADFLARFMADADACREYANEGERFERGAALWDNRFTLEAANSLGYNAERDGAESFGGPHIQPGVVGYPEMVHPITKKQGISILVEKDTLDRMRPTMKGVPIVNWAHDMSGGAQKWLAEGRAVGVVAGNRWDADLGYDWCDTMIWNKEAKANARNGFRWSNAWKHDDIDWTPGVHNGIAYDGRLVAAHYTHLAIVPDPRYKGAVIFANSLGGIMKLFGFGKDKPVELDKDASLEVGGKKYQLSEVVNSIAAAEADKAKVAATLAKDGVLGEKDTVEINGKKYGLAEVANALAASERAKAALPPETKPGDTTAKPAHETPEFQNAVDARVKETVEKMVGEGFFNGIQDLARRRPVDDAKTETKTHRTSRERLQAGRTRWGRKDSSKAAAK